MPSNSPISPFGNMPRSTDSAASSTSGTSIRQEGSAFSNSGGCPCPSSPGNLINWRNGSSGLGNAVLHFVYFVPMQFVGFFQWRKRGSNKEGSVKARRLTPKGWVIAAGVFLLGSVIAYLIIARFDKSAATTFLKLAVVLDVLPLMCNLIGQMLMSTAYMEQWIFWIGVNVFSITMWSVTLHDDPGSSYALIYIIKYSFYLLNSLNGLRNWLRLSRAGENTAPAVKS